MRLLLDTHIWVWSVSRPQRLTRKVRSALDSRRNELWLSPVSIWEVLLLAERGRLELDRPAARWVADALAAAPFRDAPLTREVALASRDLPLGHDDPADRFLAATARVYGLVLVTSDERLLGVRGLAALPNR